MRTNNTWSIIIGIFLIVLGIPCTGFGIAVGGFIGVLIALFFIVLCIGTGCFIIWGTISKIKKEKYIKENTKSVEKNIYKGLVVCKDKTSNTSTSVNSNIVSTTHTYKTTIRTIGSSSFNLYFNDEHTFTNCFEQEEVAVAEFIYKDKNDNVIHSEYKFIGTYKYYEEFIQDNISNSLVPAEHIQSFKFKDENIVNPYCK